MYIFLLMFPCSRQIQWTPPLRYDLFVWSFGESVPRIKFYPVTCRSWTKLLLVISILSNLALFDFFVTCSCGPINWSIYPSWFTFIHRHRNYSLSKNLYFDDPISRCVVFPSMWVGDLWPATPVVVSCYVSWLPDGIRTSDIIKNCNCNWKQCTVWIVNVIFERKNCNS